MVKRGIGQNHLIWNARLLDLRSLRPVTEFNQDIHAVYFQFPTNEGSDIRYMQYK